MTDYRGGPYDRPRNDDLQPPRRRYDQLYGQNGGTTWVWVAGIIALALLVVFIAFGRNGMQTASTNPPPAGMQRTAPPTPAPPPMTGAPNTTTPAPATPSGR